MNPFVALRSGWSSLGRNLTATSPRLVGWFSGGPTSSGETVGVNTSLRIETVWACIKLIAGTIATLPLELYGRDAKGRGSVDTTHPLYTIMHDLPNMDMTAVVFWETMVACLLLYGNAYAKITRNVVLQVVAITPIHPDRITRIRRDDGSVYFKVTTQGRVDDVPEGEIMYIKGFSLDGEQGISVIAQARESLGTAIAAEKAAGSLFKNGMRSSVALFSNSVMDDTRRKRYEEEFLPKFTGALNAGRVPLLEGGWEVKPIALTPEDAQLLATRSYSVEQICRWFGVQPVMIGHMEKTTAWGTGLEQMNLWFLTYTLRPILKTIEQEIRRSLLSPVEKIKYYAEFNVDGLLRADSAARAALMKVLADVGVRTRNELRHTDNMPPLPGGDILTVVAGTIPLELVGQVAKMAIEKPLDPSFVSPKPGANENQGTENAAP